MKNIKKLLLWLFDIFRQGMTDKMRSQTSNNGITDYKSVFIRMFETASDHWRMRLANISNSLKFFRNCTQTYKNGVKAILAFRARGTIAHLARNWHIEISYPKVSLALTTLSVNRIRWYSPNKPAAHFTQMGST